MPAYLVSIAMRLSFVYLLAGLLGCLLGIGGYTFVYAKGYSYLTNDPEACANCHVMREQFDGWTRSSHHGVAVCNDCHTPPGAVPKYVTKARNGFWHSFYFTTGRRLTFAVRDVPSLGRPSSLAAD
jgi:cytochrome c nitrite reductase small subunit